MTTTQETEMKKFSEQIKQDFIKALTVEREGAKEREDEA
jgi:hypothetical protein